MPVPIVILYASYPKLYLPGTYTTFVLTITVFATRFLRISASSAPSMILLLPGPKVP